MAVIVSSVQGAINKAINGIMAADAQGMIDKEVQNGYVSHSEGDIGKLFYANWQYYAGTLLHSSTGGGYLTSLNTLTPDELTYDIKPVYIQSAASINAVDVGTTSTVRLEVKYLNGAAWETIASTTKTVNDQVQNISINLEVTSEIITKGLQYRLTLIGGEPADFANFYGKCTQWYQKG